MLVFLPEKKQELLIEILFCIWCFFSGAAALLMVIALHKIRKSLIKKGLGDHLSPLRMIVHALSFLLYVFTFTVLATIRWFSEPKNVFYFSWIIDIFFGFLAYICLFFVVWHLGTNTDTEVLATTGSTIVESSEADEYIDSLRVQRLMAA